MKIDTFIDSVGMVGDDLINELDNAREKKKKSVFSRFKRSIISGGIATAAVVPIFIAGVACAGIGGGDYDGAFDTGSVFSDGNLLLILSGVILVIGISLAVVFYKKDK